MHPTTFSELELAEPIQRAIEAEGYETPTPIQAQAIPQLLAGRDLLGSAATGTGKTAAFALPVLNRFETQRQAARPGVPRALVLSPTRELAAQIGQSFSTYGQFMNYRQAVIHGGVNQNTQTRGLKRGVHLVVATPGRLLDLMNQGCLRLDELEMFVLDEADRMLDMGFLPDLKRIIANLPKNRQSLFFSATLPRQIQDLANELLTNPTKVIVEPEKTTVDQIDQSVWFVKQTDKPFLLHHLMQEPDFGRTLIFTRTRRGADRVARQLTKDGFRADAIHGHKSQAMRTRVLNRFRSGHVPVLVATDVAARGIDVDGITHVINYDMPEEPENYVHRIGRTGRAGADGIALSFCDGGERGTLKAIERLLRMSIRPVLDHPFHSTASTPIEPKRDTRRQPKRGEPRRGDSRRGESGRGESSRGEGNRGEGNRGEGNGEARREGGGYRGKASGGRPAKGKGKGKWGRKRKPAKAGANRAR